MRKLKIVLQQATAAEETRALYAPVLEKLEKLGITTGDLLCCLYCYFASPFLTRSNNE